jgi:hypothetical protein
VRDLRLDRNLAEAEAVVVKEVSRYKSGEPRDSPFSLGVTAVVVRNNGVHQYLHLL